MIKDDSIFVEERKKLIVDYVNENSKATVSELGDLYSVSPSTIRNDLRDLENCGLLRRTHGGAVSCRSVNFEANSYEKSMVCIESKKAIAAAALSHIKNGDTIALDTGTTAYELALLLTGFSDLMVVTCDLEIASFLERRTDAGIFIAGGRVRRDYHCTYGKKAIDAISDLNVDKAFLSANGVSLTRGVTTPNIDVSQMKKLFMGISSESFLLCDHTKLGKTSFARFADLDSIETLITDDQADPDFVEAARQKGVDVVLAPKISPA